MTEPARRRPVSVHLTPFARGCAGLSVDNPRRWATLWGRTPAGAVRATLERLGLAPAAVAVATEPCGGVSLCARADDGRPAPFAIFTDGLTEAEARGALAALAAEGWAPARPFVSAQITGAAA